MRVLASLATVTLAVGCAKPAPVPPRATTPSTVVAIAKNESPPPNCPAVAAGAPSPERAAVVELLVQNRAADAALAAKRLVAKSPSDPAAETLRVAAENALVKARVRADDILSKTPSTMLEGLPLSPRAPAPAPATPSLKLTVSSEKKNLITDSADWLEKNGLTAAVSRSIEVAPDDVASHYLEHRFRTTFRGSSGDHHVSLYQPSFLVVSAPGRSPRVFDAQKVMGASAGQPFDITYADVTGKTLIVSAAYNGYAKLSGGKNGYVAAFDTESGKLSWSSEALSSNTGGLYVTARHVVSGYGFTAEPDFLFVFDLATGAVAQRLPVKSGPEWIVHRDGNLFVRTYDVDYVFRLDGPNDPAPRPELAPRADEMPPASQAADRRCWIEYGLAAIDRKSETDLGRAVQALATGRADAPIAEAFRAASSRLANTATGLDLTATKPVVVAAPPWSAALVTPARTAQASPAPRLTRVASRAADPRRVLERKPPQPNEPVFLAPVEQGALPPGVRSDIPSRYGNDTLRAVLPSGARTLLVYGTRYLVSVSGNTVERIFDLSSFLMPPKVNPQWKEFAEQDVTYAQVDGGVVYVCNGGGSYAKEVFGKKAFVSALDFATGKLLWRSEPLVCGGTFAMYGDYLVTGYGFTAEPDNVVLLRLRDGKTMQKVSVESAPHGFVLDAGRIVVDAYGAEYVFELR